MEFNGGSKDQALTVNQLNNQTRQLLEKQYYDIWLQGEISNISMPSSGHWYFSLKDDQAQIRGAMFKQKNRYCKIKPQSGDQVLVRGRVSLYTPRGDYQIILEHMEQAGRGNLQLALERLKKRLSAEGLFDESLKAPIPEHPKQIGVITSPTGAAIRDILQVLKRRCPSIPLVIYPTSVQGEAATAEIVKAIDRANTDNQCDVLILARGGGSIEDLWCFNEEPVARAIARSKIPMISGVGHQTDVTIADFVADLRAPTPSAAAEIAGPDHSALLETFTSYEQWFYKLIKQRWQDAHLRLNFINRRLKHPGQRIEELYQRTDHLNDRLIRAIRQQIQAAQPKLTVLRLKLLQALPLSKLEQHNKKIAELKRRKRQALKAHFLSSHQEWEQISHRLHLISPLATLDRGYSITQDGQGAIIRKDKQCAPGDTITTRLSFGRIISKIERFSPESRDES